MAYRLGRREFWSLDFEVTPAWGTPFATVGGMMANNSSGARSVLYGKTIDHVLEQHVVLADGRIAHFRPLSAAALQQACRGDTVEARAYRAIPRLAAEYATEIERRFPKVLRRVGGYNLDAFVDASRPVDLTKIMVGSEVQIFSGAAKEALFPASGLMFLSYYIPTEYSLVVGRSMILA